MSLTKEDCQNINKWIVATSMAVEAGIRTAWSKSELATMEKLKAIERETV